MAFVILQSTGMKKRRKWRPKALSPFQGRLGSCNLAEVAIGANICSSGVG